MLQWMGGSRRKVATSRKSTQKRQKQYFEQRRRQQQLEDSVGSNYFEGNKTCSKDAENNRSLDILNLLNLSTAAPDHNSSCSLEARDCSVDDSVSYQTILLSPKIQTAQVIPPEPTKIEEPRTSSSYSKGTVFPNMISVEALGRDEKASNIADVKMDLLQSAPQIQLSVVDMLCNDEPTCCINQSSEREAHVAFSIKGLGNVEAETPVHSPEAPSRNFFQSSSPPLKAARSLHSFTDLNSELVNFDFDSYCGLCLHNAETVQKQLRAFFPSHHCFRGPTIRDFWDAMMQCKDAFLDRSFKKSSCPRDKVDSSKAYKKLLVFDEFSLFNNHNKNLSDLLGSDEFYGRSTQRSKNIWDASADLPGDKLAERGFDFSNKIWMDEMDASDDFLYSTHCRTDNLSFEGYEWQKNRSTMTKACKVEPTESPVPDFKYKSENFQKLGFSDMTWNLGIARSHDDGDLQYKPGSCFIYKEARETESLLSEESCSSTAVSGVDKKKTLNSEGRRTTMRCSMNSRHPRSISSEKMSANLRNSNSLQEENMNGQEEVTMISTPLSTESVLCLKSASASRVKRDKTALFGAEYEPVETTGGCEFDSKSSGAMKHVSSSCKLWLDDDMIDRPGGINFSEGSSFERLGMRKLPQKTDIGQRSGKLFRAQDVLVPEDESTGGDGYEKPDTSMIDSVEINAPQREILSRDKSSSSEDGNSTAALESVLKHSNYEEAPKGTLKMRNNVGEICSPKGMEEKLTIMETSGMLDGKHQVLKKFQREDQISPLSQTGFGGIEDSDPGQRMRRNEGKCTSSSPCQMIAVSYNFFAFRF